MSTAVLTSLFAYKAWADSELLDALGALAPAYAEQAHACIRTLSHIHVVDRIFRAHLAGESRPFDATNTRATPTLEQLGRGMRATDAWYVEHVSLVPEARLPEVLDFAFTDGDRGRMSREEILLHVVTHGGYHRGNVGQILKSISVAPPRDLYTKFLHESEPARRSG
ncbi:MAG TPA: DinB family protein [Caldimonas sp.]|nr:DinB family protein [Caldimonas sp.]